MRSVAHWVSLAEAGFQSSENLVSSLYDQIQNNFDEVRTLTSLRDTLLPRLISGKLRIPDAEGLVEAVAA